jgi:RsiW-degrading membrane proteinase PrsW (M82 family)
MTWVGGQIGLDGVTVGLALSTLVTIPVVGAFLWLDRWERERPSLLFSAFAWGATVAAFSSIWSQQWLHDLVNATLGTEVGDWVRPLIITPVTEEVLKGLFIIWLLVWRRREITSVLDAVVFAGLAGAGFSFTENSLYFGRAVMDAVSATTPDDPALSTFGVLMFMRVGMVPFFHPLMVALAGIGVGVAARSGYRGGGVFPVVLGLLAAVTLHGVWDWAGLASPDPYLLFKIYGAVLVPVFIGVLVLVLVLRRREGRMIGKAMPILIHRGDIAPQDADQLVSLRARRRWRAEVRRRDGRRMARAVGRYQAVISALAIRTARGDERALVDDERTSLESARVALKDLAVQHRGA